MSLQHLYLWAIDSCVCFDQIIFEGVYALHPDIRKSLDLWIAVVRMSFLPLNALSSFYNILTRFGQGKKAYEVTLSF